MATQKRMMIVDDHPIFRQGLVKIIETNSDYKLIGETGNADQALRLLDELHPDIVLVDISLPGMNGLEFIRIARNQYPDVAFVVLTMYKEEEYFNEAMDLEVNGYLLKEDTTTDLINCLKSVIDGRYFVSSSLTDHLVRREHEKKKFKDTFPSINLLTPAERKILKLIAENKTSRKIAEELQISYRTVQNHRNNICAKLGLEGYNKLLHFAIENKNRF